MSRSPTWRSPASAVTVVALVAGVAGTASGHATVAQAGAHASVTRASIDASVIAQVDADETALLEYFTFIPQAILLLIAVGLRRYVLDDEDIPWWLDGDALRTRIDRLVPAFSRRPGSSDGADGGTDSEGTTEQSRSIPGRTGTETETDSGQSSTGSSDSSASRPTGSESASRTGEHGDTASTDTGASTASTSRRSGRTSGPVPDRLALSYGDQRIVVRDGDTVDEEIRAMLRAAGEGDHAKWIDDRHLHFVHDEHGFTLVVDGENPTRLNGERLRPGDRARVYPGDEIELSGVVTLSVERT